MQMGLVGVTFDLLTGFFIQYRHFQDHCVQGWTQQGTCTFITPACPLIPIDLHP